MEQAPSDLAPCTVAPPRRTGVFVALLWMGGLAVVTLLVGLWAKGRLHPGLPIGLDIDLWGFGALNWGIGHVPQVPPGYPALASVVMHLGRLGNLAAAELVSALAMAAVPSLTWLLARQLGASLWGALLAAAVPLLAPQLLLTGHQVTPDPLTAATFVMLGLVAGRASVRPSWGRVAILCLATAWLYVLREHGLIAAILVADLLVLMPGSTRARVLRIGVLLSLLVLAPLLAWHGPTLPSQLPWWPRVDLVLSDALSPEPTWAHNNVFEQLDNTRMSLVLWSLRNAPFAWAWVALASAAAWFHGRAGRAAWLVAVLPATPALLVFSQPRHVLVVLPVAAAVSVAAVARAPRRLRPALLIGGAALALASVFTHAAAAGERVRGMAREASALVAVGQAICAQATPASSWTGEMRTFTFCPLPHYDPRGEASAALWHTLWAGEQPPSHHWEPIETGDARYPLHQLRWTRGDRPCADHPIATGSAYLHLEPGTLALEPPCDARVPEAIVQSVHRGGGP